MSKLMQNIDMLRAWMQEDSVAGNGDYDQGLMCGVEDRGYQKDGYSAMRYGYDRALERVSEYIDPIIDGLAEDLTTAKSENERLRDALRYLESSASMVALKDNSDANPDAVALRSALMSANDLLASMSAK